MPKPIVYECQSCFRDYTIIPTFDSDGMAIYCRTCPHCGMIEDECNVDDELDVISDPRNGLMLKAVSDFANKQR